MMIGRDRLASGRREPGDEIARELVEMVGHLDAGQFAVSSDDGREDALVPGDRVWNDAIPR